MWNGNGMWLPQPSSWQSFVWQACLWTSNLRAHHLSVMVDKVRQLCKVRFSWKRNAVRVNKLSLQTNKSPLDNCNGQNSWFSPFIKLEGTGGSLWPRLPHPVLPYVGTSQQPNKTSKFFSHCIILLYLCLSLSLWISIKILRKVASMQPPQEASANERGEKVEGFKISKSSHLFM